MNTGVKKPNKKVVPPPTKKELQELEQDYIAQCTEIPQSYAYKNKRATYLLRCNLCEQYLETVLGAKGHIQGKKHNKNIFKKVEAELKLVGSSNKEQFDAITVKLQQVYDEWSAEACGQQTVREKIVSDFEEFVQSIKGCESVVVELFGSTYTGFALKDSDINMNLRFRDHPNSSSYYPVISAVVERLTTMADNGGDDMVYTDFKNNLYSSLSHITFTHRLSGLSCHVRYGSHHGVPICTGKLLQHYGAVDHRVKVLAVVLKYWAKLCRLDIQELGSYPSQMFVLMLVHFLQHRSPPLLPVPPKPNGFNDSSLQQEECFNEYLSELDHMIKTWKVTSNESLGVLWVDLLRFYCKEEALGNKVVQVTEKKLLLKKDTSWSTHKLPVVLNPANPFCNMAKACSSRKMYLYLEACFKNTLVYFGRTCLEKPSTMLPTEDHSKSQGAGSCDLCNTEENTSTTAKLSCHVTCLTDVASQLSDFIDDHVKQSETTNEPIMIRSGGDHLDDTKSTDNQTSNATTTRSHDLDFDVSHDLDHNDHVSTSEVETSCEQHNSIHLEDSVEVSDDVVTNGVDNKELHYEFISSNFATKNSKLPDVCSLCKKGGHTFTSPNCPSHKKVEKNMLTCHPPLASEHLKELDEVFIDLKENICLKSQDRMLREDICSIIERHVKDIYPEAELMLFGSSANEFGSPNSDIDISMKLPGNFEHDDNAKVIKRVARHLRTTPQRDWLVYTIQPITTPRVPLVKMTLTKKWNGLKCDISLGNHLALHNTELLASYASIDERVQVMGYVLKEFAKSSDMCDASTGSLSSYAYILLLLHYLQQVKPPVIPVLQQIGGGGSVDVDGWNCWFYRFSNLSQLKKLWPHIGENKRTIGELLIDFFKYYLREFDWQRHVVCIRQLEPLSKLEREWATKEVCIEVWSYICNAFKCAHNHISNPQLYNQPVTITTVLSVGFCKNVRLCYICGKRGHGYYNCPNQKACDLCGKEGHINSQCPLNWRGHSPRCSGPLLAHPPTSKSSNSHTQFFYQFYVMPQASRYPVHQPSDAPGHGFTKKMTDFTQHTKPVNITTTRPFTSSSQPRGRSSSSNAASRRSQNTKLVRDTVGSTASDSSRRNYYQQQGGNRGRKSRTKSGTHHGTKQRHQQDNW